MPSSSSMTGTDTCPSIPATPEPTPARQLQEYWNRCPHRIFLSVSTFTIPGVRIIDVSSLAGKGYDAYDAALRGRPAAIRPGAQGRQGVPAGTQGRQGVPAGTQGRQGVPAGSNGGVHTQSHNSLTGKVTAEGVQVGGGAGRGFKWKTNLRAREAKVNVMAAVVAAAEQLPEAGLLGAAEIHAVITCMEAVRKGCVGGGGGAARTGL